MVKGIGLAEPEIIERDEHLVGLSFKFLVEASSGRFIRCWCVRLFEVNRWNYVIIVFIMYSFLSQCVSMQS